MPGFKLRHSKNESGGEDHSWAKVAITLCLLCVTMFTATGCSNIRKANDVPKGEPAAIIKPIEVIAEVTPTPPPAVVVREAKKSRSPMHILQDIPDDVEIPSFYSMLDLEGVPHVVYAYNAGNNTTMYRVYAEVQDLEDGIPVNTVKGFFNAKITFTDTGYYIETNKDENPINIEDETPAVLKTCVVPTKQNINAYISNAKKQKSAYEKALAKAQKNGTELPKEPEWDGLPILTKETKAVKIPSALKAMRKVANLYYYENKYRENEYRRYATPDGQTSGYYYSNKAGEITDGALEIDIDKDTAKDRLRQRKAVAKPSDGIYRYPVKIYLSDGQLQVVNQIIVK